MPIARSPAQPRIAAAMRTGSRTETPRGDAGYPYDKGHPLHRTQPTATPLRNSTPLRNATPLGSRSTPLGFTPLGGRNNAAAPAPSAPPAAAASTAPSQSSSASAANSSDAPFLSSWFAKEAARRQEEKSSISSLLPPTQSNGVHVPLSSAPTASSAPPAPPPLSPAPLFATARPSTSSQTAAATSAPAPSTVANTPPLYASIPAATSPFISAATTLSTALTSLLHTSASAVQSVIPPPRPAATIQDTVARWHAAQRYKTISQYAAAVSLLGTGVVLLLGVLVAPLPEAVVLFGLEVLTVSIRWLRWPVLVLSIVLLGLGAIALYRFYAPLPSLNNVSQKQRKLLGLPYTDDAVTQTTTATAAASTSTDSYQPADGIRRRNNAAVSMFASAPPVNRNSLFAQASDSPFPATSATSLFTPVKQAPLDSSGAITDEKQLQHFFAEQASRQQGQSAAGTGYGASSYYYSPYGRTSGGLSSHTPPYATSVRTLPTMVRAGPSGAVRSGRFALEDPRSDAESAERANELYDELRLTNVIDQWSRNMRNWITRVVLQPLARDIESSRREMLSLAQQVLQSQSFQLREDEKQTLRSLANPNTNTNEIAAYTLLADRYPSRPECEHWKQVARYLQPLGAQLGAGGLGGVGGMSVDNQLVASYCLNRLTQLGSRDGMASYTWNGGASIATGSSPAWSCALPTDAHLLFASFLTFLSDIYPLLVSLHYVDDSLPVPAQAKRRGGLVLHQARPHSMAPYYWLEVVEGEVGEVGGVGREWRVDPGRSNVEQCLALFVWVVKIRMEGKLGSFRVRDRGLEGLADVCG